MIKAKLLLLLGALILLLNQCTHKVYRSSGSAFSKKLELIGKDRYRYVYEGEWIHGALKHKGKYKFIGDTLVLNSDRIPNNLSLLKVEEKVINNYDSVTIEIKPKEGAFVILDPITIEINRKIYSRPAFKFGYKAKKMGVNSILIRYQYWYDYPVYYVKNPAANYFVIYLEEPQREEDKISSEQYFLDEKLILKHDTLYQDLNYFEETVYNIFIPKNNRE